MLCICKTWLITRYPNGGVVSMRAKTDVHRARSKRQSGGQEHIRKAPREAGIHVKFIDVSNYLGR